ncbi:hypothetical protein FJU31_15665 [Stenotrophomonas cyclobalanopsidis]|uniref:Pilin n=1 Tax=Stenotrophomonas cyclobalanopsidis TaxID=2771362 RepID=A0ABQ6SXP6_9GAMM|nr:pilin [Stenotrophomonas cyclobalanopsidis]KAA8995115.1 hypothetical protein FJU31_15665 [Stenotrophomonas cyclobalanopsidis]
MRHASTPPADDMQPPRARPWVAFLVAAAWITLYAVILLMPLTRSDSQRARLHATVTSLASVIQAIETSYAEDDLEPGDRHLGLPASAAFCAHLRLHLPHTGHARLSCELQEDARVHGTLVLRRSPHGAWHCEADVADPQLLPAACSAVAFK